MACKCGLGLGNTGVAGCDPIAQVTKKLIFVQTFDSTGVRNSFDTTTTLTQVALDALINHVDPTKRWYPTDILENVTGERADNIVETAPSATKYFVKDGLRMLSAEIWERSATYLKKLKQSRCTDFSVFIVDIDGSLVGMDLGDDKLYPIRIHAPSFQIKMSFATDTTVQKIPFSFDWAISEKDENIAMIVSDDIPASLLSANGLLDINMKVVSCTVNDMEIVLSADYGSMSDKLKDSGLTISDFFSAIGGTDSQVYNVTQDVAVDLIDVTETSKGAYTLTFDTTQTLADQIRVTPVRKGKDYTKVIANLATVA